jgi:anaerobic ribonucleoside-triphosphate reductase
MEIDKEIEKIERELGDSGLCEGTATVSTRISGYYRGVHNFNTGKQAEVVERLEYELS